MSDGAQGGEAPPGAAERAALELLVSLEDPRFDLADVSRLTGIDPELVRQYWRALGFPEPRDGESVFTETDVEMLSTVVGLIADGSLDPDVAIQMARVIGASLERVAVAQVEAVVDQVEVAGDAKAPLSVRRSMEANALMPRVFEVVWRRHLVATARRQLLRSGSEGTGDTLCVGFADLVGFTAQTQQLDQTQLARVVGRFETIAYDVVNAYDARVVKTIGDEVMFVTDDVHAGCRLALDLARTYRDDPDLSDVRVGLAYGPVLEREGDVYGHTVNLASRVVSIAYPGSVVVSSAVHEAVAGDDQLVFTSLRNHHLKDIGRVPLWRMRSRGDTVEDRYRNAQVGRSARHRVLDQRRHERYDELRTRAADLIAGLGEGVSELPGRLPQVLSGGAPPEVVEALVEDPTAIELEALAGAVRDADLDAELRIQLLTDIGAANRLRQLQRQAETRADETDRAAEEALREIDRRTAEQVWELDRQHRERVGEVIAAAEAEARAVDTDAARRLEELVIEAEAAADVATEEARRAAVALAAEHLDTEQGDGEQGDGEHGAGEQP